MDKLGECVTSLHYILRKVSSLLISKSLSYCSLELVEDTLLNVHNPERMGTTDTDQHLRKEVGLYQIQD